MAAWTFHAFLSIKPLIEKMGTLEQKWGPNGDPKTEKGPHGDRVPQMGTHLGAVDVVEG